MKKIAIALSAVVFLMCSAANAAELKIGVIDAQKLIQSSPEAQTVAKKMRDRFKPRQDKLVAAGKTLEADMNKLKRDDAIMTLSQKNELQDKIVREKRDLQRMQQDLQQDVSLAQNQETQKFISRLQQVVDKFAQENHYDVILHKNAVPYYNQHVDVTDQILKRLS